MPNTTPPTYYPTGVKIPDAQMNALHDTGTLRRHD